MNELNGFKITKRDRVLRAWQVSTGLVREYRGYADEIQDEVGKEYRKEFLAEGQMFFYYKRLNASRIEGAGVSATNVYVLPMPDTEIEFGERK